jgi:hypothetical protein
MTQILTFHSELAREKVWSRIHLTPVLQAEEDRDQVRRHFADKAREKELLGTETKVYNSDRSVLFLSLDSLFVRKCMNLLLMLCLFIDS